MQRAYHGMRGAEERNNGCNTPLQPAWFPAMPSFLIGQRHDLSFLPDPTRTSPGKKRAAKKGGMKRLARGVTMLKEAQAMGGEREQIPPR